MLQQDHEHVEQTEGRRRHDEEVNGGKVGDVVLEERSPSLRGWLPAARHETRNGPLRNVEPQLEQFAMNAGRAPERIGERHGADELGKLRADRRSTRSPASGLPGPEGATPLPVPTNHCLGANDVERLAPPGPPLGEPYPERAIEAPEPRPLRVMAEQGELLPERQVLKREIGAGSERSSRGSQESEYEGHCAQRRSASSRRPVSRSSFGKRQPPSGPPKHGALNASGTSCWSTAGRTAAVARRRGRRRTDQIRKRRRSRSSSRH